MLVRTIAPAVQLSQHLRRRRQKSCRLHSWHSLTWAISLCGQPKLALIARDFTDSAISPQFVHAIFAPAESRCRMFMEKVSALLELLSVNAGHKLQVQPTFFKRVGHIFDIHLLVIDAKVPDAERCTGRAPNYPSRFELAHHLASILPMFELSEIPSFAIGPESSKVQSMNAFHVQAPSRAIGFVHDTASSIELHEGRDLLAGFATHSRRICPSLICTSTCHDERRHHLVGIVLVIVKIVRAMISHRLVLFTMFHLHVFAMECSIDKVRICEVVAAWTCWCITHSWTGRLSFCRTGIPGSSRNRAPGSLNA